MKYVSSWDNIDVSICFPLQFILKVPYPTDQICVLVRAEKVFNGATGPAVDKYMKSAGIILKKKDELYIESGDTKVGTSINKAMSTYCANIGHYRMPFGWAVRYVCLMICALSLSIPVIAACRMSGRSF